MNSFIEMALGTNLQGMILKQEGDNLPPAHPPSLNEIQIRAYRIHQKHGAVYGGYTLDDWLEAEHELENQVRKDRKKDEQVH
jgi:DUF2934 family protein